MAANLLVEIISPTSMIFKGNCQIAVIPSVDGEIGVMKDHQSFIVKLKKGEIKIFKDTQTQSHVFNIENGFAEIENHGKLLVLID